MSPAIMNQDLKYALLFLGALKQLPDEERPVAVNRVARDFGLSEKFLEQVVRKLKTAGMVWATRGRNGGYGLRHTQPLTAMQVSEALGRQQPHISCLLDWDCHGGPRCLQKEIEAKMIGAFNDELSRLEVI